MPATSVGYVDVNVRTSHPPYEWPTMTYGGFSPALSRSKWSSYTCCRIVRGCGPMSLQPSPARSYEQTRAKLETPGCTRLQSTEKSPMPASRITVGCD